MCTILCSVLYVVVFVSLLNAVRYRCAFFTIFEHQYWVLMFVFIDSLSKYILFVSNLMITNQMLTTVLCM